MFYSINRNVGTVITNNYMVMGDELAIAIRSASSELELHNLVRGRIGVSHTAPYSRKSRSTHLNLCGVGTFSRVLKALA